MAVKIVPQDAPSVAPLTLRDQIKSQLPYLTTNPSPEDHVDLKPNEYWINPAYAKNILDEGGFLVVSPLRAENAAEVELSEEAETLLEWALKNGVKHIAVE